MKLIIAGSRNFKNESLLNVACDKFIAAHLTNPDEQVIIVSGKASGADSLGEKYAVDHGYVIEGKPADWQKYGKSAGYRRNVEMAQIATHCIVFRIGGEKSKGSTHMINIAKTHNLILKVIDINDTSSSTKNFPF